MPELSPPAALLRDLVRCPSVTPEEGGALTLLGERLERLGFTVHRLVFGGGETPEVHNLYARLGEAAPNLCFAGHTDVVPVGDADAWTAPPFGGEVRGSDGDATLYGRGAVDMKGAVACFVAALEAWLPNNAPAGSISLLVTGDEEGPAVAGTIKVLDWLRERGETLDACLLGEPTNPERMGDAIKIGRRGSMSGRITVRGVQGHSAYPHLADNPVRGLATLVAALMHPPFDAGTEHFEATNLEVTSLDVGNPATNVIPARASALFNVRFNDTWTADTLKSEIERRLGEAGRDDRLRPPPALGPQAGRPRPPVTFAVEWRDRPSHVFRTADERLIETVSAAVADVTGRRPALSTGGGTSDARFIKDACPVVEFGLVGQTMHQVDERVPLADLDALTAIYGRVLDRFFAGGERA